MERQPTKHPHRDLDPLDRASEAAVRTQRARDKALLGVWVGGTILTLLATVALLESCGGSGRSSTRQVSQAPSEPSTGQVVVASTLPMEAGSVQNGTTALQSGGEPDGLSVPPDVVASVSDSFDPPGPPI